MPEIIRLTIDAYEEFGKKNPIRIPHAYLATTFWEKLTNRAMYLSGEASEKLKEQDSMNKFDDEEFDIAEYERNIQKRRKRFAIGLIVVSVVVLTGMVIFWH